MTARTTQYADAERIFRRSLELQSRLAEQRQPINDELRSLLTGEYLDVITTTLDAQITSEVHVSGMPDVYWVRRDVTNVEAGSVLTLHSCYGGGTMKATYQGVTQPDSYFEELSFFKEVDGTLRIASNRIGTVQGC